MHVTNNLLNPFNANAAAHSIGFSHCGKFCDRIYNFNSRGRVDPTLDKAYVAELKAKCPKNVDPRIAVTGVIVGRSVVLGLGGCP